LVLNTHMTKITWLVILILMVTGLQAIPARGVKNDSAVVQTSGAVNTAQQDAFGDRFTSQKTSLTGHYLKLLAITGLLLVIFFFSLKYIRKVQFGSAASQQQKILVLSRQYLTPKHSVWLVVINRQKYFLGVSEHAINLIDRLGEISEEELQQARSVTLPSFGNLLQKLRKS